MHSSIDINEDYDTHIYKKKSINKPISLTQRNQNDSFQINHTDKNTKMFNDKSQFSDATLYTQANNHKDEISQYDEGKSDRN